MGYPLTEALAGFCSTIFQMTTISWLGIGALHAWIWYLFSVKPCPRDILIFLVGIVIAGPIGAALAIAVFAFILLIAIPFDWAFGGRLHQFKRAIRAAENRSKDVV